MFCDGKCKIEKETEEGTIVKRCGLFRELIMSNELTGEKKPIEMCVFDAMVNSLHRQEQGQVRMQAAVESSRNETVDSSLNTQKIIAEGFLGLIHEAENHRKLGELSNKIGKNQTEVVVELIESQSIKEVS